MPGGNPDRQRLTVSQALIRYLSAQYSVRDGRRERLIPATLGIFGHGNVAGLGQALFQERSRMPFVQGFHEQSLVHTASGFAKAKRRCATFAVTSSVGPGASNMVTGAALATINRLPVLLLPSDAYASRRQGPVLQQLEYPSAMDVSVNDAFRPVARFFDRISRADQLLASLPEAMRILTSPNEVGAVVLSLPQDVQSEAYDYPRAFFAEREWEIARQAPSPAAVADLAAMIARSERPLIIAGGGVIYAEAESTLAALAAEFGIPVAETFAGRSAIACDDWWHLGGLGVAASAGANRIARDADLVIAVGTRLADFITASNALFQAPEVRFAAINVSDFDARKLGAHPVVGDARLALEALHGALAATGYRTTPEYAARVRESRADWRNRVAEITAADRPAFDQAAVIGALNRWAEPGDTLVVAAGGPPDDVMKMWDGSGGRRAHIEFGFSCMGYELPAGIGVRMADPAGEVVVLIGDGTFLMQPSEIVQAMKEGQKLIVVIEDNGGFQAIRRLQVAKGGENYGNEFRYRRGCALDAAGSPDGEYIDVDLARIAAGMGAAVRVVDSTAALADALDAARGHPAVFVIVARIEPHATTLDAGVWWDVAPAEVSDDVAVRAAREEYEAGRVEQRWYG